jgi:hypothetical protein
LGLFREGTKAPEAPMPKATSANGTGGVRHTEIAAGGKPISAVLAPSGILSRAEGAGGSVVSDEDELAALEARLDSLDWMIALLYEAQRPLITERNRKRSQVERARQKALKQAAEYCGAGVLEVG